MFLTELAEILYLTKRIHKNLVFLHLGRIAE